MNSYYMYHEPMSICYQNNYADNYKLSWKKDLNKSRQKNPCYNTLIKCIFNVLNCTEKITHNWKSFCDILLINNLCFNQISLSVAYIIHSHIHTTCIKLMHQISCKKFWWANLNRDINNTFSPLNFFEKNDRVMSLNLSLICNYKLICIYWNKHCSFNTFLLLQTKHYNHHKPKKISYEWLFVNIMPIFNWSITMYKIKQKNVYRKIF